MSMRRGARVSPGFSLIDTLVGVAVFGLILSMIGLEFVSVVDHTLHTRADTDAQTQARTIMAKVSTHMRTAYFDVTDFPTATPLPVASPMPTASAGFVTFYRVAKGGLANTPINTCGGAPCPPYELVTIQMSSTTPGELDEVITSLPAGTAQPAIVLGTDVSEFTVTAQSATQYAVRVTVTKPSTHCVKDACSFTLDSIVYIGGQGAN